MKIFLKYGVTFGGTILPAETDVDLPEADARRLVDQGDAEYVDPADAKPSKAPAKGAKPSKAQAAEAEAQAAEAEAIEQQRKALDGQYERDALAEAAKAAGVEFAFDAEKADIIGAVMAQGKTEALLK